MQSVHHTLDILKQKLGLRELSLNDDGQAELRFSDSFVAHLTRLDDVTLELSFRLPELDHADAPMMAAMLAANCLGGTTGAGRLSIDPHKGNVLFCERWCVLDLTAERVEQRFTGFVQTGTFWLTVGSRTINELSASIARSSARKSRAGRTVESHGENETVLFRG